jgi:hypothetical protein
MRTSHKNRRRVIVALASILAAACIVHPSFSQVSTRIDGGVVSQPKFGFYWETHLSPGTPPLAESFSTETTDEPGVIHRVLLDRAGRVYVGYDVIVTVLPEPNTYRVAFQKLTMTAEMARRFLGESASSWRQLPRSQWDLSGPQDIRGGDVLQLALLQNPTTGQLVQDYVTVQEPSRRFAGFNQTPERQFAFAPGPTRDFRLDDVELTLASPRLTVNGKLDESSTRHFEEVSGAAVWIYVPKHGRYILSLVPHPELGFRKAGEVRGSSLSFVVGSEEFKLNTGRRIAPGQAPYSLYVLHEPDWKLTYPMADVSVFIMGAAGRPELLLRK